MIVYNVKRRWFTEKAEVGGREDMAALLNALCEPPLPGLALSAPATPELVDRAYVPTGRDIPDCVPDFLLKAWGVTK